MKKVLGIIIVCLALLTQSASANWWAMQQSGMGRCDTYTLLLIHSDSTDGSTVFQDSATGKLITPNGNVHHETDQKYFGTTSIYFDGINDALQVADHDSEWAFGIGDFTVDMWVRWNGGGVGGALACNGYNLDNKWSFRVRNAANLAFTYAIGGDVLSTGVIVADTWTHVAIERHGNNLNFYINGIKDVTVGDLTGVNLNAIVDLWIGLDESSNNDFPGYLDEIRISNTARYKGNNFTVPTSPYCQ